MDEKIIKEILHGNKQFTINESKELSDNFDSYLLHRGYRKESDTAREILQELESALMYYRNSDIACEFVFDIMGEIAKKHGVELTGDKK